MKVTKQCTACGRELSLDNFPKQQGTKDGLKYECDDCTGNRSAEYYAKNPHVLQKNKDWQQNNKDKHNEAAKRYYHSPAGRLNRGLAKALDALLGKKRESALHLIGIPIVALVSHLENTLPKGFRVEDYGEKWCVGFVSKPKVAELSTEEQIRAAFNWKNLKVEEKNGFNGDLGVT